MRGAVLMAARTPATPGNPRIISREMIDLFDRRNPALAGIGEIMVGEGIWIVDDARGRC
jgi:hypothetical protein